MMVKDKLEYDKFKNFIRRLLSLVGAWSTEESNLFARSLLYLHLAGYVIPVIGVFNFVGVNILNIKVVAKGLSILMGFSTNILKAACILINQKDVIELHKFLDSYFDTMVKKPELSKIVLKGIGTFRRLTIIGTVLTTIVCFCYAAYPVLSVINQWHQHTKPIQYNHVFPLIYPWNYMTNSFIYYLHIFNENLMSFSLIVITSGIDGLFLYYIFHLIGMVREISFLISSLDKNDNSEAVIKQCIFKYELLLKCREKIQNIFGLIVLWNMKTNSLTLCISIFQLSNAKSIPLILVILCVALTSLKLIQAFVLGWTGSCLTTESEKLREAIYAADWLGNKQMMNSILIMLTQKPLVIIACKYATVSIEMFSAVINTTISYYLLLKTFDID
ncbi:putative odorant receptor 92a [Cotesia glomerata]|uniref:putative odorant receptor 92a n=1 Tax=Cotesia glomerata TaxID=32391 RepID=UPI001D015B4A|nr:putative odorant receptor 92a [Cotesia glomerata]